MSIDKLTLQLCDIQDESWEVEDGINNLDHDYQNVHEIIDTSVNVVNIDNLLNLNKNLVVTKHDTLLLTPKNCSENIQFSSKNSLSSKEHSIFIKKEFNESDLSSRNDSNKTMSYDKDHHLHGLEQISSNNTEIPCIKKEFEATPLDKNSLKSSQTQQNNLSVVSTSEIEEQDIMCNQVKVKIEGNPEFDDTSNKLHELEKMEVESMLESNEIKHESDEKTVEQTKEELIKENIDQIDENLYFQEEPDVVDPDIMYNIDLDQHLRKMDFLLQQISSTPDDLRVLNECMQLPPIPQIEFNPKVFTDEERSAFNEGISQWEYEIDRDNWNKIMVKRAAVFTAHAGFDLSSEESLYVLADIATDYIKKLAGIMKKHFDSQATYSTSNFFYPIEKSLNEVGVHGGVAELIQHYKSDIFGKRNRLLHKCNYNQIIIDQFIKKKLIDTRVDVENMSGVELINNDMEVQNNNLSADKLSLEIMKKSNEINHMSSFDKLGAMNISDLESMDVSNNVNILETGNKICSKSVSFIKPEMDSNILNKNKFSSNKVFKELNITKNDLPKSEDTEDYYKQEYYVNHGNNFLIADSSVNYCQEQLNLLGWGNNESLKDNSDNFVEEDINKHKDNSLLS